MPRDPLTYRFPRTTMEAFGCDADQAVACQRFKTPMLKRALLSVMLYGWVAVPAILALLVLTGCDDMATMRAVAQEAREAPALAHAQARAEFIEIAGVKR